MSRMLGNGPMVTTGRSSAKEEWRSNQPEPTCAPGEGWANKAELADKVAQRLRIPRKRAMRLLDAVLRTVSDLLHMRGKVAIKGFGTFESRTRKGRAYKHPLSGKSVEVPDKGTVVFKPSKNLLKRVHQEEKRPKPELVLQ